MKWNYVIMNPPYNSGGENNIESKIVYNLNKIVDKVIAIYPFTRWRTRVKISKENSTGGHLVSLDVYEAHKIFDIHSRFLKYVAVWYYDNTKHYDNTLVKFGNKEWNVESYNNLENIKKTSYEIENDFIELKPLIEKRNDLYNKLLKDNKTMVNDCHGFIYEENRFNAASKFGVDRKTKVQKKLERVKRYLNDGTYKYCLYRNSYNGILNLKEWHNENPAELFKGQLCWLTNREDVKNNIKYWMSSTLVDLWKSFYLFRSGGLNDGVLGVIPALDFEMNEKDFKEYVDSLNDFNDEEVKLLKKYNIHNADKL